MERHYTPPYSTSRLEKSPDSAFRFWINPYVTVILTAPIAALVIYFAVWYTINAVFANLAIVLSNPLLWVVLCPVWIGWFFSPTMITVSLLDWAPKIWAGPRAVIVKVGLIIALVFGVLLGASLMNKLVWAFVYWIGAGAKAEQLVQTAPQWLALLGVSTN
jgi:hypothetical protein